MTRWRILLARLTEIVRGRRLDDELRDEVQHHLDSLTDEFVRRGLSPAEARAMACREFGGVDQATEAVRVSQTVRQLSIAPLLAEAMSRIADEKSVSSLFS